MTDELEQTHHPDCPLALEANWRVVAHFCRCVQLKNADDANAAWSKIKDE